MNIELIKAVDYLQKNDIILAEIIKDIGKCDLIPRVDYFESLVKTIIHQQLSVKAAGTIFDRFLTELNNDLSAEKILTLQENQFKKVGISARKRTYIIDLAQKFTNNEIDINVINKLENERLIEYLTKIKGIGRWSAEMFLIFSLNRLDVLPLVDLGFKRSLMIHYKLKKMPTPLKIIQIAKNWGNYRSIAVWYLWQSLDKNGG